MPMGPPDSLPVYEMPTEKAYLLIEVVDVCLPRPQPGIPDDEYKKPGIVARIIRRFSGRPM